MVVWHWAFGRDGLTRIVDDATACVLSCPWKVLPQDTPHIRREGAVYNFGPQEMFVLMLVGTFLGVLVLLPWFKIVTSLRGRDSSPTKPNASS